jgi:hypothetical protein
MFGAAAIKRASDAIRQTRLEIVFGPSDCPRRVLAAAHRIRRGYHFRATPDPSWRASTARRRSQNNFSLSMTTWLLPSVQEFSRQIGPGLELRDKSCQRSIWARQGMIDDSDFVMKNIRVGPVEAEAFLED